MSPSFSVVTFAGARGEAGAGPLAGYVGDSNFIMEKFFFTFSSLLVLVRVKYMSWLFLNILYIKALKNLQKLIPLNPMYRADKPMPFQASKSLFYKSRKLKILS